MLSRSTFANVVHTTPCWGKLRCHDNTVRQTNYSLHKFHREPISKSARRQITNKPLKHASMHLLQASRPSCKRMRRNNSATNAAYRCLEHTMARGATISSLNEIDVDKTPFSQLRCVPRAQMFEAKQSARSELSKIDVNISPPRNRMEPNKPIDPNLLRI